MTRINLPPSPAPAGDHAPDPERSDLRTPTVWGLDAVALHDRFWASQGVQVVRLGDQSSALNGAKYFLLTDWQTLALFPFERAQQRLRPRMSEVLLIRVSERGHRGYREEIVTDDAGAMVKFRRVYGGASEKTGRVVVTSDRRLARLWRTMTDVRTAWRAVRTLALQPPHAPHSVAGSLYNRGSLDDTVKLTRDLAEAWHAPGATVSAVREIAPGVWGLPGAQVAPGSKLMGPVWIGVGRSILDQPAIVGPAVLWDAPGTAPPRHDPYDHTPTPLPAVRRASLSPASPLSKAPAHRIAGNGFTPRHYSFWFLFAKRLFDMCFALFALAVTLPLYPFIMLAILLEDGRPIFFKHRRETRGGREFNCVKFRTMRKDAERLKAELQKLNQADGPQFFMKRDPRLTRMGKLLRDTNLDELPQFWNVLTGGMSVVGPRPSPRKENQYYPPWREARLSVRAGITGLWQIKRTRCPGLDFQEWIRFDIEYVERASITLDVWIILHTMGIMLSKALGRGQTFPEPCAPVPANDSAEKSGVRGVEDNGSTAS